MNIEDGSASVGRIYPQIAMGMIFAYSLFYVVVNFGFLNNKDIFKPFLLLLIFTSFYIPFVVGNKTLMDNFVQYLKINVASVVFMGFYMGLRNKPKEIKWMYVIFVIQLIYSFYKLYYDYYYLMIVGVIAQVEAFDSNAGFMLASLIPMSLILPSPKIRTIIYLMVVVASMLSGQRAAALAAVISVPFAFSYIKQSSRRKSFVAIIILGIIAIVAFSPLIMSAIDNILLRQQLDSDAGTFGAGRSEFWMYVIESFFNGNFFNMIVGYGYYAVNSLLRLKYGMGIPAHNGFLQYMYTFGLIGLSLYSFIYISVYHCYKDLKRKKNYFSGLVLLMLVVFFIRSATSHGDLDISYIPFFMPLAIVMAVKSSC